MCPRGLGWRTPPFWQCRAVERGGAGLSVADPYPSGTKRHDRPRPTARQHAGSPGLLGLLCCFAVGRCSDCSCTRERARPLGPS